MKDVARVGEPNGGDSPAITVLPEQVRIAAIPGAHLLESLISAGIPVRAGCGGRRTCGRCAVRLRSGRVAGGDGAGLGARRREEGWILACTARPLTDIEIEIPPAARLVPIQDTEPIEACEEPCGDVGTILASRGWPALPPVRTVSGPVHPPDGADPLADMERLLQHCRDRGCPCDPPRLEDLRQLPVMVRDDSWTGAPVQVEVDSGRWALAGFAATGAERSWCGVAVDVGTTAVAVSLLSLHDLRVIAGASAPNRQALDGDDVITRIIAAERPGGLERLQRAVCQTINACIRRACAAAGVQERDIRAAVVSGNTTMMHLLYGIPANWIRRDPYVPAAHAMPVVRAQELGISIHPSAPLHAVPAVGAYIGGDIVAGILAVGMDRREDIAVLMDIGTNGEIAVGSREFLVAAACSAGPAFEGSGISQGMRAIPGAIEDVRIDAVGDVAVQVIGGGIPAGICGSGLIAILAELLRVGLLDRAGRFIEPPPTHPLRTRLRRSSDDVCEFVLVPAAATAIGADIAISEADIAALLRAKGAMFHGLHTLLRRLDIGFDRIAAIFLAGGFGSYLDVRKAVSVGLIPDVPLDRYTIAGNTSLAGARLCLASAGARAAAAAIAARTAVVDLSADPEYLAGYAASIFIPHTDLTLFPSVIGGAVAGRNGA